MLLCICLSIQYLYTVNKYAKGSQYVYVSNITIRLVHGIKSKFNYAFIKFTLRKNILGGIKFLFNVTIQLFHKFLKKLGTLNLYCEKRKLKCTYNIYLE